MSTPDPGGSSLPGDRTISPSYVLETQKAVDALSTLDSISASFPPYPPPPCKMMQWTSNPHHYPRRFLIIPLYDPSFLYNSSNTSESLKDSIGPTDCIISERKSTVKRKLSNSNESSPSGKKSSLESHNTTSNM